MRMGWGSLPSAGRALQEGGSGHGEQECHLGCAREGMWMFRPCAPVVLNTVVILESVVRNLC